MLFDIQNRAVRFYERFAMTNTDKTRHRLYKCYRNKPFYGRTSVSAAPSSKTVLINAMYTQMYALRKRHQRYRFAAGKSPRREISGLEHLERPKFKIACHLSRTKPKHWRLRLDSSATSRIAWRLSRKLNVLNIIQHRLLDYAERVAAMQ